jgi:hypothetical protein
MTPTDDVHRACAAHRVAVAEPPASSPRGKFALPSRTTAMLHRGLATGALPTCRQKRCLRGARARPGPDQLAVAIEFRHWRAA